MTASDVDRAMECLARAFAEAPEPENYVRLFLDEGTPMARLLRDAAHQGFGDDHPQRLLSRNTRAAGRGTRPEPARGPVGCCAERAGAASASPVRQ